MGPLRIGDLVEILNLDQFNDTVDPGIVYGMYGLAGQSFTVAKIDDHGWVFHAGYWWNKEWLGLVDREPESPAPSFDDLF